MVQKAAFPEFGSRMRTLPMIQLMPEELPQIVDRLLI